MRHNEYDVWRRISNEMRGLCWDYAAKFPENVSQIGTPKSTHPPLSSIRTHLDPHHDESLYHAIYNLILHMIMCVYYLRCCHCDTNDYMYMIMYLNE